MPVLPIFDQQDALRWDASAIVLATMCWPGASEAEQRAELLALERFEMRQRGSVNSVAAEDLFRISEAMRRGANIGKLARRRQRLGQRAGHVALGLFRLTIVTPREASLNGAAALSGALPLNGQPARRLNAKMLAERAWLAVQPAIPLWSRRLSGRARGCAAHDWPHDHAP